jgi:hypothetical protein
MLTKVTAIKWIITKKKFYNIDPVTERISKASPQLIIHAKFFIISDDSVANKKCLICILNSLSICLAAFLSVCPSLSKCVCGVWVRVWVDGCVCLPFRLNI